jgi:hypothetical protein
MNRARDTRLDRGRKLLIYVVWYAREGVTHAEPFDAIALDLAALWVR